MCLIMDQAPVPDSSAISETDADFLSPGSDDDDECICCDHVREIKDSITWGFDWSGTLDYFQQAAAEGCRRCALVLDAVTTYGADGLLPGTWIRVDVDTTCLEKQPSGAIEVQIKWSRDDDEETIELFRLQGMLDRFSYIRLGEKVNLERDTAATQQLQTD